jgi:predicted nucleic acid-binding protein
MLFCDTSTLAKYYVPEADSARIRSRLDQEDAVALSELARAELMGVFHRRLREKKWNREEFSAVVRQFHKDDMTGHWTWFPLDGRIVETCAQTFLTLPETVFLRTADCIHLVTAIHHGFSEIQTHDQHQILAAPSLGLVAVT